MIHVSDDILASGDKYRLTEDLVPHVVLPDEVTQELFVDTGLVHDLDAPTSAIASDLMYYTTKGEHTAVSQNVHPNSIALSSTGSACSRVRLLPRPKLIPIAPKPGVGTWMSANWNVLTILSWLQ